MLCLRRNWVSRVRSHRRNPLVFEAISEYFGFWLRLACQGEGARDIGVNLRVEKCLTADRSALTPSEDEFDKRQSR